MRRAIRILSAVASLFAVSSCLHNAALASAMSLQKEANGLSMTGNAVVQKVDADALKGETTMRITVTSNGNSVVYALNDSRASKELYAQLPMTIDVENYGGIEKIFYPPRKLNTADTPLVERADAGTLAYYAPWGDVVMFYDKFGSAAGLYELGHVVAGREHIQDLSGTIRIEKDGE